MIHIVQISPVDQLLTNFFSFFLMCNLSLLQKDFGGLVVVLLLICKCRVVQTTAAVTATFARTGGNFLCVLSVVIPILFSTTPRLNR